MHTYHSWVVYIPKMGNFNIVHDTKQTDRQPARQPARQTDRQTINPVCPTTFSGGHNKKLTNDLFDLNYQEIKDGSLTIDSTVWLN